MHLSNVRADIDLDNLGPTVLDNKGRTWIPFKPKPIITFIMLVCLGTSLIALGSELNVLSSSHAKTLLSVRYKSTLIHWFTSIFVPSPPCGREGAETKMAPSHGSHLNPTISPALKNSVEALRGISLQSAL